MLFLVCSDPRISPRPAEAIRIAAGVGSWKKARVSLYLRGPAVLALSEFPDDLLEAENFERYVPLLREMEQPVYVQKGEALLGELGQAACKMRELDEAGLAGLCLEQDSILRF